MSVDRHVRQQAHIDTTQTTGPFLRMPPLRGLPQVSKRSRYLSANAAALEPPIAVSSAELIRFGASFPAAGVAPSISQGDLGFGHHEPCSLPTVRDSGCCISGRQPWILPRLRPVPSLRLIQ